MAAEGISVIIYVGGDVLRTLLEASPAKRGGIVVTDDYQREVHKWM